MSRTSLNPASSVCGKIATALSGGDLSTAMVWVLTGKQCCPTDRGYLEAAFTVHLARGIPLLTTPKLSLCSNDTSDDPATTQSVTKLLLRYRGAHPTRALSGDSTLALLQELLGRANKSKDEVGRCRLMLALFSDYPDHGVEVGVKLMQTLSARDGISESQRLRLHAVGVSPGQVFPLLLASEKFKALPPGSRVSGPTAITLDGGLLSWTVLCLQEVIEERCWRDGFDLLKLLWQRLEYDSSVLDINFMTRAPWDIRELCRKIVALLDVYDDGSGQYQIVALINTLYFVMVASTYADFAIGSGGGGNDCTTMLVIPITQALAPVDESDASRKRKRPHLRLHTDVTVDSSGESSARESAFIAISPRGDGRLDSARTALKNLAMAWPCVTSLGAPYDVLGPLGIDPPWIDFIWGDVATLDSDHPMVIKRSTQSSRRLQRSANRIILALPKGPVFAAHIKNRSLLQRAAAMVLAGNHSRAKKEIFPLLLQLPTEKVMCEPSPPHPDVNGDGDGTPQFEMTACTLSVLVSRAFHLLFQCYEHDLATQPSSNGALANLIVLSQHEWPLHARTFESLLQEVAGRQDFYFSGFFDYIATVDVMEEFMYLANQSTVPLNVNKPTMSNTSQSRRTNTRHTKTKGRDELERLIESRVRSIVDDKTAVAVALCGFVKAQSSVSGKLTFDVDD